MTNTQHIQGSVDAMDRGYTAAAVNPHAVEGDALVAGFHSDGAKYIAKLSIMLLRHVENRAEAERVLAKREIARAAALKRQHYKDWAEAMCIACGLMGLGALVTYVVCTL